MTERGAACLGVHPSAVLRAGSESVERTALAAALPLRPLALQSRNDSVFRQAGPNQQSNREEIVEIIRAGANLSLGGSPAFSSAKTTIRGPPWCFLDAIPGNVLTLDLPTGESTLDVVRPGVYDRL